MQGYILWSLWSIFPTALIFLLKFFPIFLVHIIKLGNKVWLVLFYSYLPFFFPFAFSFLPFIPRFSLKTLHCVWIFFFGGGRGGSTGQNIYPGFVCCTRLWLGWTSVPAVRLHLLQPLHIQLRGVNLLHLSKCQALENKSNKNNIKQHKYVNINETKCIKTVHKDSLHFTPTCSFYEQWLSLFNVYHCNIFFRTLD